MYLRMLLLWLGFPAHDEYERAAQRAMHRFHGLMLWGMLKQICWLLIVLTLPGFYFGAIRITLFAGLFFFFGFYAMVTVLYLCSHYQASRETLPPDPDLVLHAPFSEEVAALCKKAKMRSVPVCCNTLKHDFRIEVSPYFRWIIISSGAERVCSEIERRGAFAHELGHLLLPFQNEVQFFGNPRAFEAREFAADAIGACLLGDARPLIVVLQRIAEIEFVADLLFGPTSEQHTHPPTPERIRRLLDINFAARHKS